MKKVLMTTLCSIFCISSNVVLASQNKNIIGIDFGYGNLSHQILSGAGKEESIDSDMAALDIFYRRMLTSNFGLETGYRSSFGGFGSMLVSNLGEVKDPAVYGPKLLAYGELPVSENVGLHGKIGINYSTLEYTSKQLNREVSISRFGAEGAVGIHFDIAMFRLGLDYSYLSSQKFNSSFYSINTSFTF